VFKLCLIIDHSKIDKELLKEWYNKE